MKNWYIDLYVKDNNGEIFHTLGNVYCEFYDDLKTLRGVINRLKKLNFDKLPLEVVGLKIYNYKNLYDKNSYELIINTLDKDSYIFDEILNAQKSRQKLN